MEQNIIEVEGEMAVCDGGGGALGHPLEYIKVAHMNGEPVACIYCGLRFRQSFDSGACLNLSPSTTF